MPNLPERGDLGARSAFRPFCSDRCRLIDLGAWANEEHKIPDKGRADLPLSEQQLEQLENELLEQDNEFFK